MELLENSKRTIIFVTSGNRHTYLAKVFSRCQVLKSGKFTENGDDETLRSTSLLSHVVFYDQLHIVECGVSVVFISQRSFQNLRTVVRIGLHTFVFIIWLRSLATK